MSQKNKKIVKLAVIRSDEDAPCPFGLAIPYGCRNAGELIRKMAPLDTLGEEATKDEKVQIEKANNHLFLWKNDGHRCVYAGKLFKSKDVVECNWSANTAGSVERGVLVGSPFYYKHFSGIGLDGLYTYPLGYYTDNSIDRGMYYGMYSLESIGGIESENEDDE